MNYDKIVTRLLSLGVSAIFVLPVTLVILFEIIVIWKMFKKAGKKGWYALIPIYNIIVLLEIAGFKWYYIFGYLLGEIPTVGIYAFFLWRIIVNIKIAKSYGQRTRLGVAMAFFPDLFRPYIAFNKSVEYKGPVVNGNIDFHDLF